MAFTQAQVDALSAAIAGAGMTSRVSYRDGTSIQYVDRTDALALLERMQDDVAASTAATATTQPIRAFKFRMDQGY